MMPTKIYTTEECKNIIEQLRRNKEFNRGKSDMTDFYFLGRYEKLVPGDSREKLYLGCLRKTEKRDNIHCQGTVTEVSDYLKLGGLIGLLKGIYGIRFCLDGVLDCEYKNSRDEVFYASDWLAQNMGKEIYLVGNCIAPHLKFFVTQIYKDLYFQK